MSPGPLGYGKSLPSRKITPRSYSFKILIQLRKKIATTTTTTKVPIGSPNIVYCSLSVELSETGSTMRTSPSIPVTRTRAPLLILCGEETSQYSP